MSLGLLLLLAGVLLLIPTAYAGKIGAPWAPTRMAAIRNAFDYIKLGKGDRLVDLGAGDGKVILEAARRGAVATGYELSPIMWVVAKLRVLGKRRAHIRFANFYREQWEDPTVVFIFLMPDNMERLRTYLRGQHAPNGKYLLSYAFPLHGVEPLQVINTKNCAKVYVYNLAPLTNAKKSGTQKQP